LKLRNLNADNLEPNSIIALADKDGLADRLELSVGGLLVLNDD